MENIIQDFEVSTDPIKNRLLIKIGGFIKKEDAQKVLSLVGNKADQLKENAGALMDLREFTLIEKSDSMNKSLHNIMPKVKYLATVMGSSAITKMQVARISKESELNREREFFDNMEDAIKWLDSKQG